MRLSLQNVQDITADPMPDICFAVNANDEHNVSKFPTCSKSLQFVLCCCTQYKAVTLRSQFSGLAVTLHFASAAEILVMDIFDRPQLGCQKAQLAAQLVPTSTTDPQLRLQVQLTVHSCGGRRLWPSTASGPTGHKGHLPYVMTHGPQLALRAPKLIVHQETP